MAARFRSYGIWAALIPVDIVAGILLFDLNFKSKAGLTVSDGVMKIEAIAFTVLFSVALGGPVVWRWVHDLRKTTVPTEVAAGN